MRNAAQFPHVVPHAPRIVAHLIVGKRREPYLSAALAAVAAIASHVVVNDNSGLAPGPNDDALLASPAARTLTLIRTAFTGFADARNACIDATPQDLRDGWGLFFDADEVHGEELPRMAALLQRVPAAVDAIDGYSRHFVGTFRWWQTIERRLCFFRLDGPRWHGAVHERLEPLRRRIVLPEVWHHYGHVVPPAWELEKSRLYSALGQAGFVATDEHLARPDLHTVWGHRKRDVLRYRDAYPPAARHVIAHLADEWAPTFANIDDFFAQQSASDKIRNALRRLNYARLLGSRRLEARLVWGYRMPIASS